MKICLPAIALILLCFFLSAQESSRTTSQQIIAGSEQVITKPETAIPQLVKFRRGSEMDFQSFENFLQQHYKSSGHFGIKLLNSETDPLGFTHYRYRQTFDGIPVEGTMYLVHVRNGKIESMNGLFFDHLISSTAHLSESTARNKALAAVPANLYRWQIPVEEKILKEEKGNSTATWFPKGELMYVPVNGQMEAENFRLAYRFDIYSIEPLARKYVFVDAATGEVIHTQDRIETSDVVGTAVTAYSGSQTMTGDSFSGSYRLRETGRGNGVETYNLNHSTSNYLGAADFTDGDNYWNNINLNLDQYATDAHWGAESVYDFFYSFFGRNSIDGNGFKLKSYVHYSTNYFNAFWDGSEMTYGDGNGSPLTTMDICGHEISHGLTEFTSGLVYSYESGALNESFSDCMGQAIEFWKKPLTASWLIGEELGSAFRSMADPKAYGNPDTYLGTYWYTGGGDNGGVHTNSGVMNHWFYIVSAGETGTNDNSVSYTISGITLAKAQAILFRANTVYFTSSTDYNAARLYTIQAASDLYGSCSNEVVVVTNAWNAVGVGAVYNGTVTVGFSASPSVYCSAPVAVTFTNTSTNASGYAWTFGDGSTSTLANPVHTYQNYGTYTVKLVASSVACGSDSVIQTNYININSSNVCSAIMPQTGTGTTQTACTGVLYDSGGPGGNYQDNTNSTITISPTGASSVQLSFASFNIESGYDFLYVYDGATTSSPLIATLTGNYIPGLIISSGPSVTIKQTSDEGLTFSGYEMHWNCSNANATPVPAFTSDFTSTCSGVVSFTDQSLNVPTSWLWYFGDGTTSTSQNPTHTYATSGSYTVILIATNASGSNTLTKSNYISVSKSAGPTTTGATVCNSGSATLQASGGGTLNWYDVSSGGSSVNTGTSYVTPVLTNTTNYYVEAVTSYAQQGVGPASNAIGSSSNFDNSTDRYLIFDVLAPVKLVSVRVYATGAGNRTIELRNSSNNILKSKVVNMIDGQQVITLNWDLPVATALHLGIGGPSNLQRNTTGAAYPYTLSGVVSITGNNAFLSSYYYYFYDWKLQQPACISQRSAVTATVIQVPASITPSGSTSICTGGSVVLNANTGTGLTYQWKLNGGNISGATTSSYSASQAGDYTVAVTQNGCSNTSPAVTVSITQVTASITPAGSTSICTGGSVMLNANTGAGLSYQWKLNGNNISGATTSSYTASGAGGYTVVVSQNGCSTTSASVSVTVTSVTATITPAGSLSFCSGGSVILNANTGTGLSYQWKLNGNNISGATTSSYTASAAGDYTVVVSQNGCSITSTSVPVTVTQVTATITPAGSTSICSGSSVMLNANTGTGLSYQWKLNGGDISGATTNSYIASLAGNYTIVVSQNGCSNTSSSLAVTVTEVSAAITPAGSTSICSGGSVILNANTGAGLAYQWKLNGGVIGGAISGSYTATQAGDYTVEVTLNGCRTTSSAVTVSLISAPSVSITAAGGTAFCKGSNATLTASPPGLIYQWTKNGANIAGATSQSYVTNKTGNYACKVTYQCGTVTSNMLGLTQVALPIATVTPAGSVTICSGNSLTLQANTGANLAYQWKKGTGNVAGATSSSLVVNAKGSYKVVVTDISTGCSKTSAVTKVMVQSCKLEDEGGDALKQSLIVYPNPSSGDVTISFNLVSSANKEGTILVKNLLSQVVQSSALLLHTGDNEFHLHLGGVDSGMYLLELTVGGEKYLAKVIIGK